MDETRSQRIWVGRLREQPRRLGALLGAILVLVPGAALAFQLSLNDGLDRVRSSGDEAGLAVDARTEAAGAAVALWAYRATRLDAYARTFQERLDAVAEAIPRIEARGAGSLLADLRDYRAAGGEVILAVREGRDPAALHESVDTAYERLVSSLNGAIEAARRRAETVTDGIASHGALLSFGIAGAMVLAAVIVFAIVGLAVRSTARAGKEEVARRSAEARHDESESALELERRAREQLEETERLQREFVGIVSHEFRTPLTSISGFTSVLRQRWDIVTPEERAEFLDIVDRQAKRLSRLVEDLLLAGKIQEQRVGVVLERVDVRQLFRETVEEEQPKAEGREITAVVEPGAEYLVSDELRLRQVLVNLLDNSIKYSPAGSPITLRCRRVGPDVALTCEDEGPGIPREKAEHLMQRFTQGDTPDTRRAGGVGLGLYIVRNLVSVIGGHVEPVDRGDGVILEVRLPQRRKTDAIVAAGGPLLEEREPGDGTDEALERWTLVAAPGPDPGDDGGGVGL
jgi:signal transduction histidine kinase